MQCKQLRIEGWDGEDSVQLSLSASKQNYGVADRSLVQLASLNEGSHISKTLWEREVSTIPKPS